VKTDPMNEYMKFGLSEYIKRKPYVGTILTLVAVMTIVDVFNTGKFRLTHFVVTTLVTIYFVWGYSQEMKKKK